MLTIIVCRDKVLKRVATDKLSHDEPAKGDRLVIGKEWFIIDSVSDSSDSTVIDVSPMSNIASLPCIVCKQKILANDTSVADSLFDTWIMESDILYEEFKKDLAKEAQISRATVEDIEQLNKDVREALYKVVEDLWDEVFDDPLYFQMCEDCSDKLTKQACEVIKSDAKEKIDDLLMFSSVGGSSNVSNSKSQDEDFMPAD